MLCEICHADNSSAARFCCTCGAAVVPRCPHCEQQLPDAAKFCPACGKAVAGPEPRQGLAGSERKQVTVLFADFSGFTAFTAERDAEEVREQMVSIWARLDTIIKERAGRVEKHIGDAIMAVFGAPHAHENDPEQAVSAALAMQASLARAEPHCPLQMRIGIHTGVVVVGPLGETGEFAATGDSVNVASRLQEAAPVGGIVISHETYRNVYGSFDVQAQPPLAVKGKKEPIETFVVLRAR